MAPFFLLTLSTTKDLLTDSSRIHQRSIHSTNTITLILCLEFVNTNFKVNMYLQKKHTWNMWEASD